MTYTKEKCEEQNFAHNNRIRYVTGFYCADCQQFFDKDSLTYRRYELPGSYWMVINNIGVELHRNKQAIPSEIKVLKRKLDSAHKLNDDELDELLFAAKNFATKYGKNKESASVSINENKEKEVGTNNTVDVSVIYSLEHK